MNEPTQQCTNCDKWKPISEFNIVSHSRPIPRTICRECEKEQKRKWRLENPARTLPKNPIDREYDVREAKRRRSELKHEVTVAYGGKCVCCGESEELLLTIDHIYNDGKQHREFLTDDHRVASRATYAWLRDHDFPKDRYRLLCFNCNNARKLYGFCPHHVLPEDPLSPNYDPKLREDIEHANPDQWSRDTGE